MAEDIDGGDGTDRAAPRATLPPFANARNRELDRQLREKEQRLEELRREAAEQRERMGLMSQHLRNVETEVTASHGLLDGRNGQAGNELRLAKISEREAARTKAEAERLRKEERDATEKAKAVVAQAEQARSRLIEFEQQMQWSRDQLEKWAAEERAKEEDRAAIERYRRADEAKVKEMNLAIDKLTKELHRHQALLDGQLTEAHAAQIELGKVEQSFRDLNREHAQLVAQCEESYSSMQRRDVDLASAEAETGELEEQIIQRRQVIREKEKYLDQEQLSVTHAQAELEATDRAVAKKRETYGGSHTDAERLQDELDTVRMTMQKAKTTVDGKRNETKALERQVEGLKVRISALTATLAETRERAAAAEEQTGTMEQRAKRLEAFLKEEEYRAAQSERELVKLKQDTFKANQELHELKQKETTLRNEISGSATASKNLRAQVRKLDNESMKQQEVLYNQEFQLQELERRVAKMSGHKTSDEKAELNAKIQALTGQLEKETQKQHMLSAQHKKAVESLKAAKKDADISNKQVETLESAIQTLMVETDKSTKLLKLATRSKEELIVQENLARLDVKKLRDLVYRHADEVYSLEAWRHEQVAAIEEAKLAIATEADALRAQIRTLNEAKHICKMELKNREVKIEKLRRKYELLVSKMGGTADGDGDDATSQGFLLVKAAQEREELKVQRAELEEQVAKVQRDVTGLEKTMDALNAHTSKLMEETKASMPLTRAEAQQKAELDRQIAGAETDRGELQRRFAKVQAEQAELKELADKMLAQNAQVRAEVVARSAQHQTTVAEIRDQMAKLDRAKKSFQRAVTSDQLIPLAERDLALGELRDAAFACLQALNRFALVSHPDIIEEVRSMASTFALELPDLAAASRASTAPGTPSSSLPGTPTAIPPSSAGPRVSSRRNTARGTPSATAPPNAVATSAPAASGAKTVQFEIGLPRESAGTSPQKKPPSAASQSSIPSLVPIATGSRPPTGGQQTFSPKTSGRATPSSAVTRSPTKPAPSSASSQKGTPKGAPHPRVVDLSIGGTQII